MLQITRQISQYNHSSGNDIQYIVIHDTGNVTDSAKGNANYFCGGDRQSSANYFVDDPSIYQVVEDSEASWHCGDGGNAYGIGNHNSIGIEMCRVDNTVTPTTENNTIELIKYLMAKYNVPLDRVVRHYDASRKICPSAFSVNNWERWNNFKAKLGGQPVVSELVVVSTSQITQSLVSVLDVQKNLNRLKIVGTNGSPLVEDGISGTNTIYAIKKFQAICALTVDGIVGMQTNNCFQQILSKPLCGVPYVQRIPTRYIQYRLGISIDGIFGNGTKSAVIGWQKANGLSADGVIGNMSWNQLIR